MRLLNAKTFELEEYVGGTTPKYGILSHTWNKDEVLFADITNDLTKARLKHGFKKIEYCANQTLKDGFSHCWIDTCCIDKSSSAELSEAINSMFTWYMQAQKCYVYLEDVLPGLVDSAFDSDPQSYRTSFEVESLENRWKEVVGASKWFTRGWTLQELIAPRDVMFYSQNWRPLGTKRGWADVLTRITRIDWYILNNGDFRKASVAQRMSWASTRNTTREEDEAYCLMGIFDVNMPLLYGEGKKAFIRLQEEIIKNSDDQSIFVWQAESNSRACFRGLLAKSPKEFRDSQDVTFLRSMSGEPYSITNRGLRISLPSLGHGAEFLSFLNCTIERDVGVAIRMIHIGQPGNTDQYARVDPENIILVKNEVPTTTVQNQVLYVRNTIHLPPDFTTDRIAGFSLGEFRSTAFNCLMWPESNWSPENMFYRFPLDLINRPNALRSDRPTISTARILWTSWHRTVRFASRYIELPRFLFELQFNHGATTAVPGLASLLGSDTLTRHSFRGTVCRVESTYDISYPPTHKDLGRNGTRILGGPHLELGLDVINDEVVIVGGQSLKDILETLELVARGNVHLVIDTHES